LDTAGCLRRRDDDLGRLVLAALGCLVPEAPEALEDVVELVLEAPEALEDFGLILPARVAGS